MREEKQRLYWLRPRNWKLLYWDCRNKGHSRLKAYGYVLLYVIGFEPDEEERRSDFE